MRSKHSLKMEWLIPERALLKACCEQPAGVPHHKRELNENYTKGEYFRRFIK